MKSFCFITSLCLLLLLAGCFTSSLWMNPEFFGNDPDATLYEEKVSSVLLSRDGKTLVVAGNNFHYIFEAPPVITRTITSDFQQFVTAEFGRFDIDLSQKISGSFKLLLRSEVSEAARNTAIKAGYVVGPKGAVYYEGVLNGTRYNANNVNLGASQRSLTREYSIHVRAAKPPAEDIAARALLTPVTVTADGVWIIGTIVLLPLALVAAGVCEIAGCSH